MIPRILTSNIINSMRPGMVVGLFGARRTGKTYLMQHVKTLLAEKKTLLVNGENLDVAEVLSSQRLSQIRQLIIGYDQLFIDEAQKVPNIGASLKLIVDSFPDLSVFVTGSSSFDLKSKIGEPLTGRNKYFYLYPLAQMEFEEDFLQSKENLEARLIFGSYPQVSTAKTDAERKDILESIKNGVLLRDLLELDNLKDSLFVLNLLRLIAFQIGHDVSHNELAIKLGVSKNTVARYLELLEKTYILVSLQGFSRNLRKEISKSRRYFFVDNGIRNAVISNFNRIQLRNDIGSLWENYCLMERIKRNHYHEIICNYYFWRTYQQKEIDLIEERDGQLNAYEFKWKDQKLKAPKDFMSTYENASFSVISTDNYLPFVK